MNVQRECEASWQDVESKVNRSVVFMDDASAECLHWNGGAARLMSAGATVIKQFSSFESCDEKQRKAVFIISSVLMGTVEEILRDIVSSSQLQYVIVITTVSPSHQTIIRYRAGEADDKILHEMEDKLLEWMGNMNYTAEVEYIPLVTAPITRALFTLPAHTNVFPLLPTDLDVIKADSPSGSVDIGFLPEQLQIQIKGIAAGLHGCLSQLNVSEDVYALGETSHIIATELANMPAARTRRKNVQSRCSLVIVDRTVDLAEAVSHQADTLLDRVVALLPRLHGHNNDVMVNMAPVCSVISNPDCSIILPGCLAHPSDSTSTALLHTMATAKHKEALLEVNRQLVSAASQESFPLSIKPGRVTADLLHSHIAHFKGKMSSIKKHSGVVQIGQAVADALPHSHTLDTRLGLEKALLQALGDDDAPSPLATLLDILQQDTDTKPPHSLEEVFLLLLFIYSLADHSAELGTAQEEKTLRSLLVKRIVTTKELPHFLKQLVGDEECVESRVRMLLQDVFEKLRSLAMARHNLKQFTHIFSPGTDTSPSMRTPLLPQLIEAIFHPDKPDLPDLACKTTGLTDKLKKGFGLFMSVKKPRPSDQPTVVVFVLGGVTSTEARKITEAAGHGAAQVVVGGTSLLKPTDLLDRVLLQDNLHPNIHT